MKEFRNALLIFAGGVLGSLVGSKIVKSVLCWVSEDDNETKTDLD